MKRIDHPSPLARYTVATGSTIGYGALVALNGDGKAVPAADTAGLRVIGVAVRIDGGEVEAASGIYGFANDTTHALTRADRGKTAYVKDSLTVSSQGTNGIVAGIVVDVSDGEVYVDLSPAALKAAAAVTEDTNTTYGAATAAAAGLVKQGAAVADCTAAGDSATSAETQLNALLASLRTAGVIATE